MWHLMLLCSLSLLQRLTELWTAYEKEMDTSVSDFLSLHHLGSVLDCLAHLGLYIVITTCCGIDSQRLHCCCHLANNICSHWIFPILLNGLGNAPKISLGVRISPNTWFLGPTCVCRPNSIMIGSAYLALLTVVPSRHRERHRQWNVGDNRRHLMLCIAVRSNYKLL